MRNLLFVLAVLGCALWSLDPGRPPIEREPPPVATFSIVAIDPHTGDLGVAVQSKFFGVGAVVPWAKADVGAIATQAYANTTYGPEGLRLMGVGTDPEQVTKRLTEADSGRERRQVGMVDARGRAAAFTGKRCNAWAGHHVGEGFCCQGNILAGKGVVDAMAKSFEDSRPATGAKQNLPERLIAALAAGQKAGGDKRGRQSAALLVVRRAGGYAHWNDRWVDIRVEDHKRPIKELERLLKLWRLTLPSAHLPERLEGITRELLYAQPPGATPRAVFERLRDDDPTVRSMHPLIALASADYIGTSESGNEAIVYVQMPGERNVRKVRFSRKTEGDPWEYVKN